MNNLYNNYYGYIYIITCVPNGKIYIGQRKGKVSESFNYMGSGKKLKDSMKHYGRDKFIKTILDYAISFEELNEMERYYIKLNNATNPDIGYNICEGGSGMIGLKHEGELNGMFGKTHTNESKLKNSNSNSTKIWMHKDGKNIRIDFWLKDEYLALGYVNKMVRKNPYTVTGSLHFNSKPWSDERKRLFSLTKKRPDITGKNNPMYGRNMYQIWVEKYGVDEANIKLADFKRKVECEYCHKLISRQNYTRWHGTRCKLFLEKESKSLDTGEVNIEDESGEV